MRISCITSMSCPRKITWSTGKLEKNRIDIRIGWMKFRESGELLLGRKSSSGVKSMVYRSCVRSAVLYGNEIWCLKKIETAILRRTERAMVRSMCRRKLEDRKNNEELMEILGLKEPLDYMAKANGVRWYGHVVRRDDDGVPKRALMLDVNEKRKRGRPKQTWRRLQIGHDGERD